MRREKKEVLSDRLLLLWLLYDAMTYKSFGITKTQKLAYLSEKKMIDNREKGFNYDFIKLTYGPYSEDLEEDIKWLQRKTLVRAVPIGRNAKIFRRSVFGGKLLSDFHELFLRNNVITRRIARVNRIYATKNSQEIVRYVHGLPHPYLKNRIIDQLKPGTKILYKLEERKAQTVFDITPEELATLDIYLDHESYKSAIEASESARRKPLLGFDEVF